MALTVLGRPASLYYLGTPALLSHLGRAVVIPGGSYLTPAFVQVTDNTTATRTPSRSITATEGNMLVAVLRSNTVDDPAPEVTTAGWTTIFAEEGATGGTGLTVAVKVADGGTESVSADFGDGYQGRIHVYEFSNVDPAGTPQVAAARSSSSVNTLTVPASPMGVVKPSMMLVVAATSGSISNPSSTMLTERWPGSNGTMGYTDPVGPGGFSTTLSWTTSRSVKAVAVALPALAGQPDPDPDPEPPVGTLTRFGINNKGMGSTNFGLETATGHLAECVRIYTTETNDTTAVLRSPNARDGSDGPAGMGPDVDMLVSFRFAENPEFSDAYIIERLEAMEDAAQRLNEGRYVWFTMNPEMDRTDRPYSYSEFRAMHTRVRTLGDTYCPSVRWALNPTGYQILQRIDDIIGNGDILDEVEALWVDPYWTPTSHAGKAAEVLLAHEWANEHGLRFAVGEYGVERFDGTGGRPDQPTKQAELIPTVVEFLAGLDDPVCDFAPYFHNGQCEMEGYGSTGSYAAYAAAVTAAKGGS